MNGATSSAFGSTMPSKDGLGRPVAGLVPPAAYVARASLAAGTVRRSFPRAESISRFRLSGRSANGLSSSMNPVGPLSVQARSILVAAWSRFAARSVSVFAGRPKRSLASFTNRTASTLSVLARADWQSLSSDSGVSPSSPQRPCGLFASAWRAKSWAASKRPSRRAFRPCLSNSFGSVVPTVLVGAGAVMRGLPASTGFEPVCAKAGTANGPAIKTGASNIRVASAFQPHLFA